MASRTENLSFEEWDERLTTGIASLDDQHRLLFQCIDLLAQAASERNMLRTFYVMEQLSQFVHTHFAEEEFLMRVHEFPGLADHIREHRSFANRLHQLHRIYLDRDISIELIVMLKDWLRNHVAKTDMEYVPHLTATLPVDPAVERDMMATAARTGQQVLPCFS